MLGLISGTIALSNFDILKNSEEIVLHSKFGQAKLLVLENLAIISRHRGRNDNYIFPHMINHRANMAAMRQIGVTEIIGISSTGSLKKSLCPGSIVIPHDFIMLNPYSSAIRTNLNKPMHITPSLDDNLRQKCLDSSSLSDVQAVNGSVYWQTRGPRLESKAEVAMMSNFADIVGMTMASEAIIAQEMDLRYASICTVDNYANGIGKTALTDREIFANAQKISKTINQLINAYITKYL